MKHLNLITGNLFYVMICVAWIMGVVMAKGFWLTTLSIFLPFYAWYLVVEEVMKIIGFGI